MQKIKCIRVFFMAVFAVALLSAATRVGATTCTQAELNASTCFSVGGLDVRAVAPFPSENSDGSTTFTYAITGTAKNLSTIDVLVPVCNADVNMDGIIDYPIAIWTGDPNGWRNYPLGQGSSNTNFGAGVQDYVFEQNFNSFNSFYLRTTKAAAGITSMGLKVGSTLYSGSILGPSCYTPKPASTTGEQIQLDPLDPAKTITVFKDADGRIEKVLDASGNTATSERLADSQIWVCNDPILNSDGSYNGCNDPLSQLTYVPDGTTLRFGKHTLSIKFYTINGCTYQYCFCGAKAVSCTSPCP